MSVANRGIYLLLGGNLGNVVDTFKKVEAQSADFMTVERKSSLYRSVPWKMRSEHQFINQVWLISTRLAPEALLRSLLGLEEKLGRQRKSDLEGYQDRLIDIDILLFKDLVIEHEHLKVPHPRMKQRAFTLKPLLEIAPSLIEPLTNQSYQDSLALLSESEKQAVERIEEG